VDDETLIATVKDLRLALGRGATFYLLVCRECQGDLIPFESAAKRGKWATEHTKGTGHNSWFVFDREMMTNASDDRQPDNQG
jgi:hypothetical protein